MSGKIVSPIFHDDKMARSMLLASNGIRYVNVHENWNGNQFYGPCCRSREASNLGKGNKFTHSPSLYRIVVRLKERQQWAP